MEPECRDEVGRERKPCARWEELRPCSAVFAHRYSFSCSKRNRQRCLGFARHDKSGCQRKERGDRNEVFLLRKPRGDWTADFGRNEQNRQNPNWRIFLKSFY